MYILVSIPLNHWICARDSRNIGYINAIVQESLSVNLFFDCFPSACKRLCYDLLIKAALFQTGKPLKTKGFSCHPFVHLHYPQGGRGWKPAFCQNSPSLHREFSQTVPLSLSEKGGLTEPETEKEKESFPAAVRHTWAHGGTKCLAKKG